MKQDDGTENKMQEQKQDGVTGLKKEKQKTK